MRSTLVALGSAALLGLATSQGTDTFVISQCECPGSEFSSVEKDFFSNPFRLAPNAEDDLQCFGDDDFPVTPGFTAFFTDDADSTGLSTSASADFFFSQFPTRRTEWYVAIRMVVKDTDGVNIRLLEMNNGDQNFLNVNLSTFSVSDQIFWDLIVTSELAPLDVSLGTILRTETSPIDIIIGEGTKDGKLGVFSKFVVGTPGNSVGVSRHFPRDGFLPVSTEDDLSVNMFSGSTDGEPFALQVKGFQFGNGNGASILIDGLEDLEFAPVAALPSVSESKLQEIISAVAGESIEIDVTRFLEGGDIALDELEIIIDKGDLDGTFEPNPPGNPFTYTPSNNFVGNQTFSFSYGLNQPYSCFREDFVVKLFVAEGSTGSSSKSNAGTVVLSIFITALVVGGLFGAATVYRKRLAEAGMHATEDDQEANSRKELSQGDAKVITV